MLNKHKKYLVVFLFFIQCPFFLNAATSNALDLASNAQIKLKPKKTESLFSKSHKKMSLFLGLSGYSELSSQTKKTAQNSNSLIGFAGQWQSTKKLQESFNWKAEGQVFYATSEEHIYFDIPDLYSSYKAKFFEISAGRKKTKWSLEDDIWQRGLWAPRNFYNLTQPMSQSLTGFYLDIQTKSPVFLTAFVSPFFIPDLGIDFEEKDGSFISKNPNFKPPGSSVALVGDNQIDLKYRLINSAPSDIIYNPSFALKAGARWKAFNMSLSGAIKPMNQIPLVAPIVSLKNTVSLLANVTPEVVYHTLAAADFEAEASNSLSVGGAVTYDQPHLKSQPATTLQKNVDTTWIYTGFLKYKFNQIGGEFLTSYTHLEGGDLPDIGRLASRTDSRFPIRYQYNRALKLKWNQNLTLGKPFQLSADWNYDFIQKTTVSLWQASVRLSRQAVLSLSYSHIALLSNNFSDPREMYWHAYEDTDALDLRLSYAF